jgi:SOS-response transcriptional repressor LexA
MLTARQQEILDYIKRYRAKFGHAPGLRCICDRFDIPVSVAAANVRELKAMQLIINVPKF